MKSIRNYILDNDLKIIINNGKIDIQNYNDIGSISEKEILIYTNKNIIKINGTKLKIGKLLSNEILILGNICSLIFEGLNE